MQQYLYLLPGILIAITLHEWAHGFVSWKLGDPTPQREGRLSLNPVRHLSLSGVLCMLIFHFGWCRPVMVNPGYYRKPKQGMALVSLAGPGINLITGLIARFIIAWMDVAAAYGSLSVTNTLVTVYRMIYYFSMLSINLAIFNLIPIPPLDGSKILALFLPDRVLYFISRYQQYFFILLIGIMYFGFLDGPMDAIYNLVDTGLDQITYPIFIRFFAKVV